MHEMQSAVVATAKRPQPKGSWALSYLEGRRVTEPRQTAHQRGYNYRWQQVRKTWLSRPDNACCRMCDDAGIVTPATVIDHVIPHRGDQALFWDKGNWQPLCKRHHDSTKQADEARGKATVAVDADGWPQN